MILSLVQTAYQIRDGKLIGITHKDRWMGMLPCSVWRYFDGGIAENNTDPFILSREQTMYLLVVTVAPNQLEGIFLNCSSWTFLRFSQCVRMSKGIKCVCQCNLKLYLQNNSDTNITALFVFICVCITNFVPFLLNAGNICLAHRLIALRREMIHGTALKAVVAFQ